MINDLVAGKVVRYKSFDGLEIPAIYYNHTRQVKKIKRQQLYLCTGDRAVRQGFIILL